MRIIRKLSLAAMFGLFSGLCQPQLPLAAPVRGLPGDLWADLILGQPDFSSLAPFDVTAKRIFNQGGVLVDRVSTPQRLYVYDAGNSRVLGFSDISAFSPNATITSAPAWAPDIILGQQDFTHSGCNRDSNYQNYPSLSTPGADTLCGLPEFHGSPREGGSGANMSVDPQGNLYVPDFWNNRVLRYNAPVRYAQPADFVWGQPSFNNRDCNGGGGPSASSLCFVGNTTANVGGTGIDSAGNLWVADMGNNRVLRFPVGVGGVPQTTADLVLGQPNFNSNAAASNTNDLTRMSCPSAVRVDPSGNVYVTDFYVTDCGPAGQKGRVLVFKAPIVSGQSALGAIHQYLSLPMGLEFDPDGGLWVSDYCTDQMLLFDITLGTNNVTATVRKTLLTDRPVTIGALTNANKGDGPDFSYQDGATQASYRAYSPMGGVGVDRSGNFYVGLGGPCDVWRFPAPIPTVAPTPPPGPVITAHSADVGVFKARQYGMLNDVGSVGLHQGIGVAAAAGQLIVADTYRLMYWNMPSGPTGLTNGQPADGFAGVDPANVFFVGKPYSIYGHNYAMGRIREDHTTPQRLWAVRQNDTGSILEAYRLPLTTFATPEASLPRVLPLVGGAGSVSLGGYLAGLAPDRDGTRDFVWVADKENNRVLRIRHPLSMPQVDIILGQANASATFCNQVTGTYPPPTAKSFCDPGQVTLDHHGNLYVSDFALEFAGNQRLLRFNAGDIQNNGNTPRFGGGVPGISASAVYGRNNDFTSGYLQCQTPPDPDLSPCGPWEPAFTQDDSTMILGTMYIGSPFPLVFAHPAESPLLNQWPLTHTNDFGSTYYGGTMDDQDNLYVTDLNRSRILVYLRPFETPLATPTAAGTVLPTYTVTRTPTPIPASSWSPTPTFSRTPTAIATWTNTGTPTSSWTFTESPTVGSPTDTPTPVNTLTCCAAKTGTAWDSIPNYDMWGVAVDRARQQVYAADPSGNFLYVRQYDGTAVTILSGFTGATGVAIGPGASPAVYLALRGTGQVRRYDPTTWSVTGGMPGVGGLRDLHVDPSGNLYVSSDGPGLTLYNGSVTPTPIATVQGLNNPTGMWKDPNDLYVADSGSNRIVAFEGAPGPGYGTPTVVATVPAPQGITRNGAYFYVTANSRYYLYDSSWNLAGSCSASELVNGVGIALDETGRIYVASRSKRVAIFDSCPLLTPTSTMPWTPSPVPTSLPIDTATFTPSLTFTLSPTPTVSFTSTSTPTFTHTHTPSWTFTQTPSWTSTPTPSHTWTRTFTPTSTPTFTWTVTWTPTPTGSGTASPTPVYPGRPVVCQPNPVRSGETVRVWWNARHGYGPDRITLVTVADRVLKSVELKSVPAGAAFLDLELKDRWGRPLANGLYLVRVDSAGLRDVGKLVVLR